MKPVFFVLMMMGAVFGQDQLRFNDYFLDQTLRIDYYHTADKESEIFTLDQLYRQGPWAGSTRHLIEPYDLGTYRALLIDIASNRVIFSKGFNSYCEEYRTTAPAREGIKRTFHETVLTPFPKKPVRLVLEVSDRENLRHPVFSRVIDPADYHIISEAPGRNDRIYRLLESGPAHQKVDLLLLGEGYTEAEGEKFAKDARRYCDLIFQWEPYKSYRKRFNVSAVFSPSRESGTDEPRRGIYKNTVLNTSFNALDSERYLLTEDNRTLRDIAGQVPYDALLIMINSARYGGGGIYNAYTTFTADDKRSEFLLIHEMGHSFAGLADEYYTSSVSYEEFFAPGVEPRPVNITALLDPENLKWQHLLSPGIAIPTDWQQDVFDSLSAALARAGRDKSTALAEMKAAGASETALKTAEAQHQEKIDRINAEITRFFVEHPLRGKVGAFEGGGYAGSGLYRPTLNSVMHKFMDDEKTFYPVNSEGIIRVIDYYSE